MWDVFHLAPSAPGRRIEADLEPDVRKATLCGKLATYLCLVLIGFLIAPVILNELGPAAPRAAPQNRELEMTSSNVDAGCPKRERCLAQSLFRAERALQRLKRSRRRGITAAKRMCAPPAESTARNRAQHPAWRRAADYASAARGGRARARAGTAAWGARAAALWGLRLWAAPPPPPAALLRPARRPGDCWPFRGSRGEIVVSLWSRIRLSGVTLEHIRPDVLNSAPKEFHIYSFLANNTMVKSVSGEYASEGPAKQFFSAQRSEFVDQVMLSVHSNHGNPKYTCIYRLQVHGYKT